MEGSSHFIYRHPVLTRHLNIPVHDGKVKRTYVLQAIVAINEVKERIA